MCRNFEDAHKQEFLRGHGSSISCLALSKERGTFLASGDSGVNSDIVVWDFNEKQQVWCFSEHDGGVRNLSFSHDERLLVSIGHRDNRLVVWDVKTGMIVAATDIPKSVGHVNDIAFGGFVKTIKRRDTELYKFATVGDVVCTWSLDPYTGELAFTPAHVGRNIRKFTCLAFVKLPDSCGREGYEDEWLLAGTLSGDFSAFILKPDPQAKVPKATYASSTKVCSSGVVSLCVDPINGSVIAAGGGDGAMIVFSHRTDESPWVDEEELKCDGACYGLAMSADGREVIVGTTNGMMGRCFRGSISNSKMIKISENHSAPITCISFAPGSNDTFATGSKDGSMRVWSIENYSVLMQTGISQSGYPLCVYFSIDAVLTGWTDGCIRSHHSHTGELLWTIRDAHAGGVTALKLSHNMRYIISGGEKGDVRVWELRHRQLVSHLQEHTRAITQVLLFEDDMHAISCSKDKSFLCWDLKHDKRISSHVQRTGGVNDVALNHNETIVITVGQEKSISFWDLRQQLPVLSIDHSQVGMHEDEASCIAVSNDGNLFATGGADLVVKLWMLVDSSKPVLLQNNYGHTGNINALKFTDDDRQLVSVADDGAIFVWNIFNDDPNSKK